MGQYIRTGGSSSPHISAVTINTLTGATVTTNLQNSYDKMWSAGIFWGANYTDAGNGVVAVSTGEGVLRMSASGNSEIRSIRVAAHTGLTMTLDDVSYIYADYNDGNPVYSASTNLSDFNCQDKCLVYTVYRCSTNDVLDIVDGRSMNEDFNTKHRRKLFSTRLFDYSRNGVSFSAETGLNVALAPGSTWYGLNKISLNAFSTGQGDLFDAYYRDGSGGYVRMSGQTLESTLYDNGTGTLATASEMGYTTKWFYQVINDQGGSLAMVYGRNAFKYVTDAQEEGAPSGLPARVSDMAKYVGRVIVQRDNNNIVFLENALAENTTFPTASHDGLSNLQGGVTNINGDQHYHFTEAEHSYLQNVIGGAVSADTNFTGIISSGGTDVSSLLGNASPGGSSTVVQYNDGGVFAGSSKFRYLDATDRLIVGTTSTPTDNGESLYVFGHINTTGAMSAGTIHVGKRATFDIFSESITAATYTLDLINGALFDIQVSSNSVLDFTNLAVGTYILMFTNSGVRTITLATSSNLYTPSGLQPVYNPSSGALNMWTCVYDGSKMWVTSSSNYVELS